jgi:PIN domain nuclease of toxin-antitoxin system
MSGVLLDTCAAIWLAEGARMSAEALDAIEAAAVGDGVLVSPVTGWEIGLLSRGRAGRPGLAFLPDLGGWLADLMALPGLREAPLDLRIATAASLLPGSLHNDPADRLIIATARVLGVKVVTRDSAILAYGAAGFVGVVGC